MFEPWSPTTLMREAWANLRANPRYSLTLLIGISLLLTVPGLLDSRAVRQLEDREAALEATGGYVLSVASAGDSGLRTAECEALAGAAGVEEVVWLRRLTPRQLVPGGLVFTWAIGGTGVDVGSGIGVGTELAANLLVVPGDTVRVIRSGAQDRAALIEIGWNIDERPVLRDLERVIAELRFETDASECRVAVEPWSYDTWRVALAGGFSTEDESLVAAEIVQRNVNDQGFRNLFLSRDTRNSWIMGAALSVGLVGFWGLSRRRDCAVYRVVGATHIQSASLVMIEFLMVTSAAAMVGQAVLLFVVPGFGLNYLLAVRSLCLTYDACLLASAPVLLAISAGAASDLLKGG